MFSIDAFTTFSTAIFVFIVICYVWALLYSTQKIGSLYVGSLLKGILLVGIAICFYILIRELAETDGANPDLLAISGIVVVAFSIIPKPPEEWTTSRVKNLTVFRPLRPVVGQVDQVPLTPLF